MEDENGKIEVAGKLMLIISWDEATQSVQVEFDHTKFKTFEFTLMIVEAARLFLEDQRRMAQMVQMQQMAQEAKQAQAIAQKIRR